MIVAEREILPSGSDLEFGPELYLGAYVRRHFLNKSSHDALEDFIFFRVL